MDDVVATAIWISAITLLLLISFLWAARPLISGPASDEHKIPNDAADPDRVHEVEEHHDTGLYWYYP